MTRYPAAVEILVAETAVVPGILLLEEIINVSEAELLLVVVVILPLLDEEVKFTVVPVAPIPVPMPVLLLLSILLSKVCELHVVLVSLLPTNNDEGVEDITVKPVPRFTATVVLVLSLVVNPKEVDEIDDASDALLLEIGEGIDDVEVVAVVPILEGRLTVVLVQENEVEEEASDIRLLVDGRKIEDALLKEAARAVPFVPFVPFSAVMVALRPYNAASTRADKTASKRAKDGDNLAIMIERETEGKVWKCGNGLLRAYKYRSMLFMF